jgi:elongation factor Ts
MAAGRIEAYTHGDAHTPNKGGSLVEVTCQTDFAAKTDEFIEFAKWAAKMTFAMQGDQQLLKTMLESQMQAVSDKIGEPIGVRRAVVFNLADEKEEECHSIAKCLLQCLTGC